MAEIVFIGTLLCQRDPMHALGDTPQLPACCGRPSFAITVRLVGHISAGTGEHREIIFGSTHTMLGDFCQPERAGKALADGWPHPGDVSRVDAQRYYQIVGRSSNPFIRVGLNLAPSEVEAVPCIHSAVRDAAVVGIPDEKYGKAVTAVVAIKDGMATSPQEVPRLSRASQLSLISTTRRAFPWKRV